MISKKTLLQLAVMGVVIGGALYFQTHPVYALDLSGLTTDNTPKTFEDGTKKANELGKNIWFMVRLIGFWICAIYGGIHIIREITQGDIKEIIKVVIKYVVGLAILVFFLDILTIVLNLA